VASSGRVAAARSGRAAATGTGRAASAVLRACGGDGSGSGRAAAGGGGGSGGVGGMKMTAASRGSRGVVDFIPFFYQRFGLIIGLMGLSY
jgi:hypothetical protein